MIFIATLALSACSRGLPADPPDPVVDAAVDMRAPEPDAAVDPVDAAVDDGAPDASAPDAADPDAALSDAAPQDAALPDMTVPDMIIADMAVPDMVIPDMAVPDVALPDQALPDMMVVIPVDMAIPDAAEPDMAVPDMAIPDMAIPDAAVPDLAIPDAAEPDMAIPDMAIPDMADPCAAQLCDAPPPPRCVDDGRLERFEAPGECAVDDGVAVCSYGSVEEACDADEICDEGVCGPPPPPRPGELVITEFMPDPASPLIDRLSQWVEIQNVSARPLDLAGCRVDVDRGSAELDGELAAGAVLLVGNGDDPDFNGGLPIAAVFNASISIRGGTLAIKCGPADPPALVDEVVFERFPRWQVMTGFAMALEPELADDLANDDAASWCIARDVYLDDPAGANYGTPGAPNPPCAQAAVFARHDRPVEAIDGPGADLQVFGRLRHPGITDRSTQTDRSPLVIAEVGYGPDGTLPGDDWVWATAGANIDWTAPPDRPDLDEYRRIIQLPDRGRYDIAWRFSVDAGRTWTLADGDPPGSLNGYQPASAGDLRVEGVARVRGTGEIIISELYTGSDLFDGESQWVELHNPGAEPLDLTGCSLDSPEFVRAPLDGLQVPANGWLAVPRVADPARNGGIETPLGFGFELPRAGGTIALSCRFEIDRIRWDDGVLFQPADGASLQLSAPDLNASANDDAALWCPGDAIYDPPSGRRGTPGQANRDCGPLFGYPGPQLQVLFDVHCGECHLNGQSLGDLSLEPFELNTFRIPAVQLPGMHLVTPGDRQQSYLWHKLSATHFDLEGADGVQMPPGQPFKPGVIERIGLYVDELPIDAEP